jgi:sensor c-di-GMP phosphodiesterase-like protein
MYDEAIYAALRAGEFELNYLPTVRLSDGRCIGAEALIRWQHDGVWVEPAEFIPRAEGTGLGGLITYWVIDTVADQMKDWLLEHPHAHLSINVPPDVLGRGGIEYAGAKSGLSRVRNQIVLEVTERGVPDAQGIEALDHMARNGVRIALDDVTMDGANLALLSRCRFDYIKLDRQLTTGLIESALPDWLLGLRALLAHASVQVVAEGVESAAQATLLQRCGVTLAQGHLFSPALSATQFRDYFTRYGAAAVA